MPIRMKLFFGFLSLFFIVPLNAYAFNFGTLSAKIGKELQNINPFSLNTPEKRSEDFYKNATKKEFDCVIGTTWVKLIDGYLTYGNNAIGEVRKLSKDRQLLVILVNTGRNITCDVDNRDWQFGEFTELSACTIPNRPILMCQRAVK